MLSPAQFNRMTSNFIPDRSQQPTPKRQPDSWNTAAYDAHLAATHPHDDEVLLQTARNPAPARVDFNKRLQKWDETKHPFKYGICTALFTGDSDTDCLAAVKHELEHCYEHSPTFRRLINYHLAKQPQERITLRRDTEYSTTVTPQQIEKAGGRVMTVVLDEKDALAPVFILVGDRLQKIEAGRALTHEMVHFTTGLLDDNDAQNPRGGPLEFNNIFRLEAHNEEARAAYGCCNRLDDGEPEKVGEELFHRSDKLAAKYDAISRQFKEANAEDKITLWPVMTRLYEDYEKEYGKAVGYATLSAFASAQADRAAWQSETKKALEEQKKAINRIGNRQTRDNTNRGHREAEHMAYAAVAAMPPEERTVVTETVRCHTTHSAEIVRAPHKDEATPALSDGPAKPAAAGDASSATRMPDSDANQSGATAQTARVSAPVVHYTVETTSHTIKANFRGQFREHQLQTSQMHASSGNSTKTFVEKEWSLPNNATASLEHVMQSKVVSVQQHVYSGAHKAPAITQTLPPISTIEAPAVRHAILDSSASSSSVAGLQQRSPWIQPAPKTGAVSKRLPPPILHPSITNPVHKLAAWMRPKPEPDMPAPQPYTRAGRTPNPDGTYEISHRLYVPIQAHDKPEATLVPVQKNAQGRFEVVNRGQAAGFNAPLVKQNENGSFRLVPRPGLRGGMLGKIFGKRVDTPTAGTSSYSGNNAGNDFDTYEMPVELREAFQVSLNDPKALTPGYDSIGGDSKDMVVFKEKRNNLAKDAGEYFDKNLVRPPRPAIPPLHPAANPMAIIKDIYAKSDGLVLGETHASIASKKFLIDNMKQYRKIGVKTLYMEHLQSDVHQADLALYFKSKKMPANLSAFIKNQDRGHGTDPTGKFTFMTLIKAAGENGIRIVAIDSSTSYQLEGMKDPSQNLRQKVMNYYAAKVINHDQAKPHKWVALVGNTHLNTYKNVPGLAELQGTFGVRIEDVQEGHPDKIELDAGRYHGNPMGESGMVKCDLVVKMGTRSAAAEDTRSAAARDRISAPMGSLRPGLKEPGDFCIETLSPGNSFLIHKSSNGGIVETPIHEVGDHIYIERPNWSSIISNKAFESHRDLIRTLVRVNRMTYLAQAK